MNDGAEVRLKGEPVYERVAVRPTEFRVTYSIDGEKGAIILEIGVMIDMLNEKIYQTVFDAIAPLLSEGWSKLVIYLEYGDRSYSFSFYNDGNKYIKCFHIANVSEDALYSSFKKIDKIVASERKKVKSDLWSNITITIESNGSMRADFDYSDSSSGTYRFKKAWKKKCLV